MRIAIIDSFGNPIRSTTFETENVPSCGERNLNTAHAVATASITAPATPVVIHLHLALPAQVPQPGTPVPNNPQAQTTPAAPVGPPPAQQPDYWRIGAFVLAALLFFTFLVMYITDPVRDIEATKAMGGNDVEMVEFTRFATFDNGVWSPAVSYTYVSTAHSLQRKPGATFILSSNWKMQTKTVFGDTTFRDGERHDDTIQATFNRTGGLVSDLQGLFHR